MPATVKHNGNSDSVLRAGGNEFESFGTGGSEIESGLSDLVSGAASQKSVWALVLSPARPSLSLVLPSAVVR